MGKIAVIHRWFSVGGGESVCFHILEALQEEHTIHIYGLNEPDFQTLNEAFGTEVDESKITVHVPGFSGVDFESLYKKVDDVTGGRVGSQGALQLAILKAGFGGEWNRYDLRITTHGELPLSSPTIQYIHHPFLNRWRGDGHFQIENNRGRLMNRALTKYIGADPESITKTTLLTNSEWSARQLESIYGVKPQVIYPPIRTEEFDPIPWKERENGFVTVGRIAPDKHTLRACEIIQEIRQRGYKIHLHIVGPDSDDKSYVNAVRDFAKKNEWVTLEGVVGRERLVHLIEFHRWGLHTKPYEHFGIVVAEYVAGGMVPFVPATGGQVEIVSNREMQTYDSRQDAINKISEAISRLCGDAGLADLGSRELSKFSVESFSREITQCVSSHLGEKTTFHLS